MKPEQLERIRRNLKRCQHNPTWVVPFTIFVRDIDLLLGVRVDRTGSLAKWMDVEAVRLLAQKVHPSTAVSKALTIIESAPWQVAAPVYLGLVGDLVSDLDKEARS